MKLSIIIPVYNEFNWISQFWHRLKAAPIDKCPGIAQVELVVVDDGSTDNTQQILAELCRHEFVFACGLKASIQYLPQQINRGKGYAVRTGIKHSTGDVVLVQDADMEYSPKDYPTLLQPIADGIADAVFGSRFIGYPHRVLYFWHYVMNKFLTTFSNMFCDLNLTDMETCYKVVRGDLARSLRLTSNRFGIEPEITARLARARVRIYEVPISYAGRTYEEGKKIRAKDGIAAILHILRFGLWDKEPFLENCSYHPEEEVVQKISEKTLNV